MPETEAPAEPQREGTARRPALPASMRARFERWEARLETVPRWALFGGLAVVLAGCFGTAAVQVVAGGSGDQRAASAPVGSNATAGPSVAPGRPAVPRASTTPVRQRDDLGRVCDGWYYPGAPRYTGKGPHPISIGVRDQAGDTSHRVKAALDVPYTLKPAARRAWMPTDPATSQLVACVTLARTGGLVRSCPDKVALKRGVYRLAVYEVATGRRLAASQVDGDVVRCPNAIALGTGGTIATTVSGRLLYLLLNRYVVSQSTVSRR